MLSLTDLSIVIVQFQTLKKTLACINSIYKSQIDFKVDVWVVDNGSTDNSPDIISKKFPQVKLIANRSNLFYSQANNIALKKIRSKYFLVLNSDIILFPSTLQKMSDFMESHSVCGLSSCRQVDAQRNTLLTSHRSHNPFTQILLLPPFYKMFKNSQILRRFNYDSWDRRSVKQVETIPGSFMFGKTKILNQIGFFDESMALFYSDADLCERIRKAGYSIYHNGETSIIHDVSSTLAQFSRYFIEHQSYRDMVNYYRKHFGVFWARLIYIFTRLAIFCDIIFVLKYCKFTLYRIYLAFKTWFDYEKLVKAYPQFNKLSSKITKNYKKLEPVYKDYTAKVSFDYMAISLETAAFLISVCQILKPKILADLGSGFSTYVFNIYAKESKSHVDIWSVDDDENWLKKTRSWLMTQRIKPAKLLTWKDFCRQTKPEFDLVFHDLGNMETRILTLPEVLKMVKPTGFLILDDLQFSDFNRDARKILRETNYQIFSLRKFTQDHYGRYAGIVTNLTRAGMD